ncbi:MAG: helix-turn-helix domain-containing protein [Oscillibacter sp.]|nr:helix-turn-helix domain-containing protein [Oscillibacter sp.]
MGIGQRITQKRKELGLSQEALGEQLGVSRQSIYKWESDTALPEIEKLITLSRLFGVSVGWLLGVEEDAVPPSEASGELTETQLKMVEEITARYLAAQPKPRRRSSTALVILVIVLLATVVRLFNRLDDLDIQYSNLQNSVSSVTHTVDAQINNITDQVEEILKSQNALTAEYGTELIARDLTRSTATFTARAVPKTFAEGMRAVFLADSGDGPAEFPAELFPGQTFTGELTVPLTDAISLSVVFINPDGTRQTQLLDTYSYLYSETLPEVDVDGFHLILEEVPDGRLELHNRYITIRKENPIGDHAAQATDVQVGFFRNQKLVSWAIPCEKPENFDAPADRSFYLLPDVTLENLTSADKLYIAALVTDNYGRQFMVSDIPYVVQSETSYDTPYITYPSDGRYDSSPANWEF